MSVWSEHRLLLTIGLLTSIVAIWELSNPDEDARFARERRSIEALSAVYPQEARLRFEQGTAELAARDFAAARHTLEAVYDDGFKEDERLYLGYIDAIMMTTRDTERIGEVVARWRRDYPRSPMRTRTEERLRESGILP